MDMPSYSGTPPQCLCYNKATQYIPTSDIDDCDSDSETSCTKQTNMDINFYPYILSLYVGAKSDGRGRFPQNDDTLMHKLFQCNNEENI